MKHRPLGSGCVAEATRDWSTRAFTIGIGGPAAGSGFPRRKLGKGQLGSALMGSLQISCVLTEGLVGYSR